MFDRAAAANAAWLAFAWHAVKPRDQEYNRVCVGKLATHWLALGPVAYYASLCSLLPVVIWPRPREVWLQVLLRAATMWGRVKL